MGDDATRQPVAVLLHGGESAWRRALRALLLARAQAPGTVTPALVVLMSSRVAEAAKWLPDSRLALIVSAVDVQLRLSIAARAPAVDVLWLQADPEGDAEVTPSAALVEEILRRLRQSGADVR